MNDKNEEEKDSTFNYEDAFTNYFDQSKPVCREERQFAAFLYLIFDSYRVSGKAVEEAEQEESILQLCGIPIGATIEQVVYEATYMRDFFEFDRIYHKTKNTNGNKINERFNRKLVEFMFGSFPINMTRDIEFPDDYNFRTQVGISKLSEYINNSSEEDKVEIIQKMMNVKPDIAVVYRVEEKGKKSFKKYMKFFECKYLSGEHKYKLRTNKPPYNGMIAQTDVQFKVVQFLSEIITNIEKIIMDENATIKEKNKHVAIVRFTNKISDSEEVKAKDEIPITINKLIKEYEKAINSKIE